ncbi:hypothetical protein PtB15_18B295 [Puccinia triticina]|nr:hypothetical protein PtB15_18B295 [Puccinia triticina]
MVSMCASMMNMPQHPNQSNRLNVPAERTPEPPPQALPTSAPSTPLVDTSTLDGFFGYAHVQINQVEEGLNELGITHWSMFKCYEVKELTNSGFPDAPARALIQSANSYGRYLSSTSDSAT